jgi:hypothetical protein
MAANRREFLLGAATVAANVSLPSVALAAINSETASLAQNANAASPFLLEFDGGALTSLRFAGDAFPTNYVATGQKLGHVEIAWRRPNGPWQKFHSADAAASPDPTGTYHVKDDHGDALIVTVRLEPQGSLLRWTTALSNQSSDPIEVGDVALPLPMHSSFGGKEPPTASVLEAQLRLRTRLVSVLDALQQRWPIPGDDAGARYASGVLEPPAVRAGHAPRIPGVCTLGCGGRGSEGRRRPLASASHERCAGAHRRSRSQPHLWLSWRGRKIMQACGSV